MSIDQVRGLMIQALDDSRDKFTDFVRYGADHKESFNNVEFEVVQNDGQFHDGCEQNIIFKVEDKYYRYIWWFNSWDSPDYREGIDNLIEVTPREQTVTIYE